MLVGSIQLVAKWYPRSIQVVSNHEDRLPPSRPPVGSLSGQRMKIAGPPVELSRGAGHVPTRHLSLSLEVQVVGIVLPIRFW